MNPKYAGACSVCLTLFLMKQPFHQGSKAVPVREMSLQITVKTILISCIFFQHFWSVNVQISYRGEGVIKSITWFMILREIVIRSFLRDCREFLSELKFLWCLSIVQFYCTHALWLKPVFSSQTTEKALCLQSCADQPAQDIWVTLHQDQKVCAVQLGHSSPDMEGIKELIMKLLTLWS